VATDRDRRNLVTDPIAVEPANNDPNRGDTHDVYAR